MVDGCDNSSEIALWWTSLDLSDDKSTLVQVMASLGHNELNKSNTGLLFITYWQPFDQKTGKKLYSSNTKLICIELR